MSMPSPEQLKHDQDVEYYSALAHGWVQTRMAKDKGLLSLSAAGIGLLVTLLTSVGVTSRVLWVLYTLAILLFAFCLVIVLIIFHCNSKYLSDVINKNAKRSCLLKRLDLGAAVSFGLAVCINSHRYNSWLQQNGGSDVERDT